MEQIKGRLKQIYDNINAIKTIIIIWFILSLLMQMCNFMNSLSTY